MKDRFSQFLDWFSEFFSQRKGLLPLTGIVLVLVNLILQFTGAGWLQDSNLFLHLGVIVAVFGIMVAWAL